MKLALDHLAVFAADLETGHAWVSESLGIDMAPGGRHPLMATHNRLARLGDEEFLEVIAIDPEATPARPRWFGLDRLGNARPRLGTWAVRTDDIDAALKKLPAECGPAIEVTRGELVWRLSVPDDGSMLFDGLFPTIIEWPMRPLPATHMMFVGCALETLTVRHPEAECIQALMGDALGDGRVHFETGKGTGLEAMIATPDGLRRLR